MSTNRARPSPTPAAYGSWNPNDDEFSLHQPNRNAEINVEQLQAALRAPRHRAMTATLEYLARVLTRSVYIEDIHGHLLFAPSYPRSDDWRKDFTPLSTPDSPHYDTALAKWRQQAAAYVTLTGDRSVNYQRTVVPLVYHGSAFAFIHFVDSTSLGNSDEILSDALVATVADKLYMLFFGEMNEHRENAEHRARTTMPPRSREAPRHEASADFGSPDERASSHRLCFKTSFHLPSTNPVVDYPGIARRVGGFLARHLEREWPDIVVSQVNALETATEVELSVHTWMPTVPDLTSAATAARRALHHLRWNLKVGIGSAESHDSADEASLSDCERACREASVMLALADRTSPGVQQVLTRREAPASSILLFRDDSHSFRSYAAFITHELERSEPELMTTARTYARNDCNASATADALHVDRRTVSDRLHRISDLTGLEIPSFASKVIIYLAFLSPSP